MMGERRVWKTCVCWEGESSVKVAMNSKIQNNRSPYSDYSIHQVTRSNKLYYL